MSKLVDARGLPCPQPVILTKAAMQENQEVMVVVDNATAQENVTKVADRGVTVLACGTCLGHFGLKEKLAVGEISNMYTIAETLLEAGKTVTI